MSKNYRQLWNDIIDANSETKAVRTLAEILADKEGRTFISHLGREDAKLCIEILDRVRRDLHLLPSAVVSGSLTRASESTTSKSSRSKLSSSH